MFFYNCSLLNMCIHFHPPPSLPQLSLFLNNQTCCWDTFATKARFYHFFLHQTQSKQIYPKSGFGRAGASGPSTREVGRVGGLAASNLLHFVVRVSLDFLRPEQTRSQSSSHRCRYKYACFLRCVCRGVRLCSDWLWCARDYGGYA